MNTSSHSIKTYERPGKTKPSDLSLNCRMCLSRLRFTEMIEIFLVESEPLTNASIINFCTGLEIRENDGLPTRMCTECYRNLLDFFAFKRMCLASDDRMKAARDAALIVAEIPEESNCLDSLEIKPEPEDELSLTENGDLGLLETDGFHPDAPDEVFCQIRKFEDDCIDWSQPRFRIPRTPVTFKLEENDFCTEEEDRCEDVEVENPGNDVASDVSNESVNLPNDISSKSCPPASSQSTLSLLDRRLPIKDECTSDPNEPPRPKVTSTSDGLHVCPSCCKEFRSACSLRRHTLIHSGPQHSCPHCMKQFTQKDSLKRHMLTHMDRRLVCAECSKVLMSREGLKCHIRTHHTDRSQTSNYFKYKCQECNKRFAHASGLSRHTAIHRGVKYECLICSKKFNDSSQLRRHAKSHLKDANGSRSDANAKENISSISSPHTPVDASSEAPRLPSTPVMDRVDTRKATIESRVLNRKKSVDNPGSMEVVPAMSAVKNEIRTEAKNSVVKLPCNSKLHGEENRSYVLLQPL